MSLRDARHPVAALFNARGDYLLNLPALRALAHVFAGRLTLVCRPGARHTLLPDLPLAGVCEPALDLRTYDERFDADAVAAAVAPCDLLLSLSSWHARCCDRLLARLGRPPAVGFFAAYDHALPLDFGKHNADLAFDVVHAVAPELRIDDFAGPPRVDDDYQRLASAIRRRLPAGMRLCVMHTETKADKMWPHERFVATLDALLAQHPELVVLVVDVDDHGLERCRHADRVVHCRGLPLAAGVALVGLADLFIGVDSCFLHAADLHRVPGVGLFGPTSYHEFGFRFGPHCHVQGQGTMDDIRVDMVLEAAGAMWSHIERRAAARAEAGKELP